MNGTSVSNGTRLSPINISQRKFGNFPDSLGKGKRPRDCRGKDTEAPHQLTLVHLTEFTEFQ